MKYVAAILLFLITSISVAQQTCEVKLAEIKGNYTGDCENGKASGKGKSVGTDEYEGDFKDGYPEGKGMYIWKDGHYFIGSFKKGKKEGKGDMYYEGAKGDDSVITGYWKKDKYVGHYENKYEVVASTTHIGKVNFSLLNEKGDDILITVHQLRDIAINISSITILADQYNNKTSQQLSNSSITNITDVVFPFRAIFYLSNGESVDLLFNEKGDYDVYIDVQ